MSADGVGNFVKLPKPFGQIALAKALNEGMLSPRKA
jgi:hypothetical protein